MIELKRVVIHFETVGHRRFWFKVQLSLYFSADSSDMEWILSLSSVQACIRRSREVIKVRDFFGSVYSTPGECENAALFIRLGLPSTILNPLGSFPNKLFSQTGGI